MAVEFLTNGCGILNQWLWNPRFYLSDYDNDEKSKISSFRDPVETVVLLLMLSGRFYSYSGSDIGIFYF